MIDKISCCAFCVGLGMVVGGVIVSNNSKVRNWLKTVSVEASEKMAEMKNAVEEKLDDAKNNVKTTQDRKTKENL